MVGDQKQQNSFDSVKKKEVIQLPEPETSRPGFIIPKLKKNND